MPSLAARSFVNFTTGENLASVEQLECNLVVCNGCRPRRENLPPHLGHLDVKTHAIFLSSVSNNWDTRSHMTSPRGST